MKNLLSLLAALGLTATAATTVIACGSPKNSVVIKKTALKDLNLKTRLKNSVKNQQAAFDSFIKLNPEVSDLGDDVQVIGFTAPDYNQTGTLEVQAKTNTKYSGTLIITIPELNKTDIARLVTNTTIQGTENMTADQAFQAILAANSSWTNLSDYVDFNNDEYVAPSSTSNGSLTIIAKATSEFSGNLTISISKLVDLNTLNLTAITGIENMNDTDAFNAFLANQDQNLSNDFSANVTYTLVKPGYATTGSLTINAKPNTEYTGSIKITINAIGQTSLDSLQLNTSLSIPVTNQQAAFDSFIELNPEVSDLGDDVQVIGFTAPDYNQTGTLEVQAKTNTKYSGTLTITIPELNKTDITSLITITTIQGAEKMTQAQAFEAFLAANSSWTNLGDYVEASDFTVPGYATTGSLTINAKPNTEYTGSIKITINAIGQTSLNDLNLKTLLSAPVTNQEAAFDSFIELNAEVSDLRDNVQITGFTASNYNQTGSLEVQAKDNSKYNGMLTITIPELNKTDIASLINNTTIQGTENMTQAQAFEAFLAANSSWTNLSDYVEASDFKGSDYVTSGSLTITAKPNTEYTGAIKITINAIGQTSLDSLQLNTSLSIPVTNQEAAFDSFIELNAEVSDLRDNVQITGFTASNYNQSGSLEVQAKPNTKYSGTLTITIPELNKTDINSLINNTTIQGNKNMTQAQAFEAFLTANSSWKGLDTVVEVDSYQAPAAEDGYLIVKAKPNTQFSGSVKVTVKRYLVDKENLAPTFYGLSTLGWYDFDVVVNTKVEDLIGILNQRIKQLYLDNYGAFADDISDINTILVNKAPTQAELDTVGTVWRPSRFDMNGKSWSSLRLTVHIDYKDGSSEDVIVYDFECSITVVAAE